MSIDWLCLFAGRADSLAEDEESRILVYLLLVQMLLHHLPITVMKLFPKDQNWTAIPDEVHVYKKLTVLRWPQ